jgi:hypothetical protein
LVNANGIGPQAIGAASGHLKRLDLNPSPNNTNEDRHLSHHNKLRNYPLLSC